MDLEDSQFPRLQLRLYISGWAEPRTLDHSALELSNRDAVLWIRLEDHTQNIMELIRYAQGLFQVTTIFREFSVRRIFEGCPSPWIASGCEVG